MEYVCTWENPNLNPVTATPGEILYGCLIAYFVTYYNQSLSLSSTFFFPPLSSYTKLDYMGCLVFFVIIYGDSHLLKQHTMPYVKWTDRHNTIPLGIFIVY